MTDEEQDDGTKVRTIVTDELRRLLAPVPIPPRDPARTVFNVVRWTDNDYDLVWKARPADRGVTVLRNLAYDDLVNLRGVVNDFINRWRPEDER